MRSHRRRTPLQHVLIAGTADELACMRSLISMLPSDSYGQVLLEAGPTDVVDDLGAPSRVSVLRVRPTATPGAALAEAVDAWVQEWMPHEADPSRSVGLWVGAGVTADRDARWLDLSELLPDATP